LKKKGKKGKRKKETKRKTREEREKNKAEPFLFGPTLSEKKKQSYAYLILFVVCTSTFYNFKISSFLFSIFTPPSNGLINPTVFHYSHSTYFLKNLT